MSRKRKFHNPKGIYFVSFSVVKWLKVFSQDSYANIVVESLKFCQTEKSMEIIAWCIMPDHVHLVYRSASDALPQDILRDIKKFTSKHILQAISENIFDRKMYFYYFRLSGNESSNVSKYQFWQHDNFPIELIGNQIIKTKVRYIHQNPVKSGLVEHPERYKFSSAIDYADGVGLIPNLVKADIR